MAWRGIKGISAAKRSGDAKRLLERQHCRPLFQQREAAGAAAEAAFLRAAGSVGLLPNDISHPELQ